MCALIFAPRRALLHGHLLSLVFSISASRRSLETTSADKPRAMEVPPRDLHIDHKIKGVHQHSSREDVGAIGDALRLTRSSSGELGSRLLVDLLLLVPIFYIHIFVLHHTHILVLHRAAFSKCFHVLTQSYNNATIAFFFFCYFGMKIGSDE